MLSPFLMLDLASIETIERPEILSDRVWDDLKGMLRLCPHLHLKMNQNTEETLIIDGDTEVITINNAKDLVLFLIGYRLGSDRLPQAA